MSLRNLSQRTQSEENPCCFQHLENLVFHACTTRVTFHSSFHRSLPYFSNPLSVRRRFSILPILTKGPKTLTPSSPQPSVLTQMPLMGGVPQSQYCITQALPIGQPPFPNAEDRHVIIVGSPQLNLFLSKQMPLPSTDCAQVHSTVPLLAPHILSQPQRESQGVLAHTPLTQSR